MSFAASSAPEAHPPIHHLHMMFRLVVLLLFTSFSLFSQTITPAEADSFAAALLWNKASLKSWIDPATLDASNRLGVSYEGVTFKTLIAYDFDDSIKSDLRTGGVQFSTVVESLDQQYAHVTVSLLDGSLSKDYYFKGKYMVSPFEYATRSWSIVESEYFRFILSDSTLTNPYCRSELDKFVARTAKLLELSDKEMRTLHEKKIYYYLCKDEDEIMRLTGFRARGMANLAYDAVVTTYNFHAHELLHLLMNFKLRRLPLFTHLFMQEGFAVAFGGRGGLGPNSLLLAGKFLFQSEIVDLPSLLNGEAFRQLDASLSYSTAGLYNKFLIEKMGVQSYLRLYRSHSANSAASASQNITSEELPDTSSWKSFLSGGAVRSPITLDTISSSLHVDYDTDSIRVAEDSSGYYFRIGDVATLTGEERFPSYRCNTLQEFYPGRIYKGEKYMFRASKDEISVYNLFTNTLICSYAASLSIPPIQVSRSGGKYSFRVRKDIFDTPFSLK